MFGGNTGSAARCVGGICALAALLVLASPAAAIEFWDDRLAIHGFYESQFRAINRDFHNGEDWDITQWYHVFNLEIEGEIAAASYTLDSDAFPILVESAEIVFGTFNADVTTTTEWSVLFWEGTPDAGEPVLTLSSDGVVLQPLEIGPGNNGVILTVVLSQLELMLEDNGSHTFSVGFRVDDVSIQFRGVCSKCRRKAGTRTRPKRRRR